MNFKNPGSIIRMATIGIVIYLLCFGIAQAFFPIRPFWNDEWRLIYNIKFKDINGLWGRLDLLQECPRAYLTVIKIISERFDYSYTSLRLPPLIIGIASIFFLFYLRKKMYPGNSVFSYLFILILVSSQTFTDYLVQVKHYEMDILLCLLALWQLMMLLKLSKEDSVSKFTYLLLCLSFLVVPYFSYVYPIAVAPIFPVILIESIRRLRQTDKGNARKLVALYFPLVLVSVSIIVFYLIDVKNVMADTRMYDSYMWSYYKEGKPTFLEDFWNLFALVGSGFVFEIIFGVLGIASFLYSIFRLYKKRLRALTTQDNFQLYAIFLVVIVSGLFLSGKLIGGVARLTAYTVPAISILIIAFLQDVKGKFNKAWVANVAFIILIIGLFGNIISTCINTFAYSEYSYRINTYRNTALALKKARKENIPLLFTDRARGDNFELPASSPGRISSNTITPEQIEGVETLCAEAIIMVNPEYKVWDPVPLYFMPDGKWVNEYMNQLPVEYNSAVVVDGVEVMELSR